MERELKVGMHLVFIDAERQERDALLLAIHGDPQGRLYVRQDPADLNSPCDLILPDDGPSWPCVNLVVVVDKHDGAQDQYGRQTLKEGHTSIVHWKDNSAQGFCYRFADEVIEKKGVHTVS